MRVMVLVKATDWSERGLPPADEFAPMMEAMGRFNEELMAAGVIKMGEGLHPTSKAKRVTLGGGEPRVADGPFGPAHELIAGFWLWEVRDMDEAVAWAKRCPDPMPGGGVLELRPVFEADDFGDALSPELRVREAAMRARLAAD